jgi:ribosomal protein S3
MGQKTNASLFRLGLKNSEWNYKYLEKNSEESTNYMYKSFEINKYINIIFKRYQLRVHSCKIEYTLDSTNLIIIFYNSKNKLNLIEDYLQKHRLDLKNKTFKHQLFILIKTIVTPCLNNYLNNKTINIKTKNINQNFETQLKENKHQFIEYKKFLTLFRRFLRNPWQKELIKILILCVFEKNSSKFLADYIAFCLLKQKKRHNYLLFILKKSLNNLIYLNFSKVKGIKIMISGRLNGAPRSRSKILNIGNTPLQSIDCSINYATSTAYTPNGTLGIKVWMHYKIINYVFTT